MSIPSVQQLYQAVQRKPALSTDFGPVDHSRPFTPEPLTQLYHTEHYRELSTAQRLRYNQLFAMRAIEQLMTLEARFIAMVIHRSQRHPRLRHNTLLLECMGEMVAEEVEHYRMFRDLNLIAEPAIYQNREMYFAHLGVADRMALELLGRTPGITPFLLWTLLILEEFSTYISRQMLQQRSGPLGKLEENFVKAHREHLKDESRHVATCANALDELLSHSGATTRRLNATLLHRFMGEYMTPKRGGLRVIRHLCREFPELGKREALFLAAIRRQSPDPLISGALASSRAMPVSNALMARFPEFAPSTTSGGQP